MYSYLISNFLSLFILSYIGNNLFIKRFSLNVNCIVFVLFSLILTCININSISVTASLLVMAIHVLYYFLCFKGRFFTMIFSILFFIVFQSTSEVFVSNIFDCFYHSDDFIAKHILLFAILTSSILCFILTYFMLSIVKKYVSKYSFSSKTFPLFFVLPATTLVILLNLSNYFRYNSNLLFIFIGLVVSNFLFIYLFFKDMELINKRNEAKLMEAEHNVLKMKFELLNTHFQNSFDFLHNTIKDMNSLQLLLNEAKFDLLNDKLIKMNTKLIKEFNIIYTNSNTIGVVLNNYLEKLTLHNIEVKSTLIYNDLTFMADIDQITLFDNSLDIALNSCISSNENYKFIFIKIFKDAGSIVIKFQFNSSNCFLEKNIMDKVNEIESLLKRYHGNFYRKNNSCLELTELIYSFIEYEINEFFPLEHKLDI